MKQRGNEATRQQGNKDAAFTLVEMVVVVAVVIVLITLVVPAASALWRDRRIADAQNMISGQLMSARARALQGPASEGEPSHVVKGDGTTLKLHPGEETGLFFFVGADGVQRVAAIVQMTPESDSDLSADANRVIREAWANVFNIVPGRVHSLPAPMRVVPRYVVCEDQNGRNTCDPSSASPPKKHEVFSPEELANDDFSSQPAGGDAAQRHRNFFALVYSPDGQLLVGRDVLIRDPDDVDEAPGEQRGDVTGLKVLDDANVKNYFARDSAKLLLRVSSTGSPYEGVEIVGDDDGTALNFPTVDGLLVYDESLFAGAGDAEQKRQFLIDSAAPFYVHRLTGSVIRGPVGEAVATGP